MSKVEELKKLTRREALLLAAGATIAVSGGLTLTWADAKAASKADEAIKKMIGDKKLMDGKISFELPQIAENGNTVPIKFSVESPMTSDDYVKAVHLYAEGNPLPDVATIHFLPINGKAEASTRIRLARTQNLIAVAEMSDGSVYKAAQEIKVTIGGCGG